MSDNPFVRSSQITPRVLVVNGVDILFPIMSLSVHASKKVVLTCADRTEKIVFDGRRAGASVVLNGIVRILDALGKQNEAVVQEMLTDINNMIATEKAYTLEVQTKLAELQQSINDAIERRSVPDAVAASSLFNTYVIEVIETMK